MEKLIETWASLLLTLILSTFGLCGYVLYIYVIFKNRQQRFANPFYHMTLSWAIPELYRVLQGLIVSAPILVAEIFSESGSAGWIPKWYRTVSGFFFMVAWLATVSHMLALAVNRVIAVYKPAEYKRLYSHTRCAAILLSCYFYAVFVTAIMLFGECQAEFVGFSWRLVSASEGAPRSPYNQTHFWPTTKCSPVVFKLYVITWNGLVFLTVIFDICAVLGVFFFKKRLREQFRRQTLRRLVNHQWSLTAQFTLTVGLLAGSVCVYWIAPVLVRGGVLSDSATSIFMNSAMLVTCGLNPYIYILLGAMVRRQVFGLPKHEGRHNEALTGCYAMRQMPESTG